MNQSSEVMSWAEGEFGGAQLCDSRRTLRLVQLAAGAASEIGAALSSVCGGSGAQAVSRLMNRKETTVDSVLEWHTKQTDLRCANVECVLAVQDTTVLDFSSHKSASGLGSTGSSGGRGLLMHSVLAVSDDGVPLGILGEQIWARSESEQGIRHTRRKRATCEKESIKWLRGLEQAQSATSASVPVIVIGDRESDVYALFTVPRRENVDLLVRLAHNRAVADSSAGNVRKAVAQSGIVGSHDLGVPRQGSRKARTAHLEVRVASVLLKRPCNNRIDRLPSSIRVQVIHAVEVAAPEGVEPLDWMLLTTCQIGDLAEACQAIQRYSRRWIIEEFHRVLKSGCRFERVQFECVESIMPAIALLSVVAWRVLHLTKTARTNPDADACNVADADELAALGSWLRSQGSKDHLIQTVRQFTIAVARLGGFLARKSDGMPGTKTVWQGLRNLEMLVTGYKLATQLKM
jgi:hypothetical protein